MRSDYGEGELRRALGVDVGADGSGGAEGAEERPPEGSSERSSEGGGTADDSRPLLLFPCPGAEYLEVMHTYISCKSYVYRYLDRHTSSGPFLVAFFFFC